MNIPFISKYMQNVNQFIYRLQSELYNLKSELYKLQETNQQLENRVVDCQKKILYLEHESNGYKNRVNCLEKEVVDHKSRISYLERKMGDYEVCPILYKEIPNNQPTYTFVPEHAENKKDEQVYYTLTQSAYGDVGPYSPSYIFEGDYINGHHQNYAQHNPETGLLQSLRGIDGFLRTEDALKIYEMAYYSNGNILQLGTFKGLSTSIIVEAINDKYQLDAESGNVIKKRLKTVDINKFTTESAISSIKEHFGEQNNVEFFLDDGTDFMDLMITKGEKFGFIFIDHAHTYHATYTAALRVNRLLNKDGYVLFHDYKDYRNLDNSVGEWYETFGIYQAAHDALMVDSRFEFQGIFGCTGLFKYLG